MDSFADKQSRTGEGGDPDMRRQQWHLEDLPSKDSVVHDKEERCAEEEARCIKRGRSSRLAVTDQDVSEAGSPVPIRGEMP